MLFDIVYGMSHHSSGFAIGLLNGFALVTLVLWILVQVIPLLNALRQGVLRTGTIIGVTRRPRGGRYGRLRFDDGSERQFVSVSTRNLAISDRLEVLANPATNQVVVAMGPGSAAR